MANKIHVKKDDQVIVISGKDKGTTGKVLKAVPETGRVYVEGVNIVKKHQKARTQAEVGGIIEREGSVDASNVMIVCPFEGDIQVRVCYADSQDREDRSQHGCR